MSSLRPLCLGIAAVALLAAACGGSSAAPEPTSIERRPPKAAATKPRPTTTPTPSPAPPSPTPPHCPDPYPAGAPYAPQPGQPIRLRPTGSPPPLPAWQPAPLVVDPELERIVRYALAPAGGRAAVVVKHLVDGRGVAFNPGRVFYAASLFKTWVMFEAFHQRAAGLLDFAEAYVVTPHYVDFGLNHGELAACDRVTIDAALGRMMSVSDNVAANLVLDRVGAGNVNQALAGLGLRSTSISAQTLSTTAADMALLLEAIARRQALDPAASDGMLQLLASETIDDRLPALLPPEARVAHKTGNWENATHDAGIVTTPKGSYLIVVLSDFGFKENGAMIIGRLSRAVYDYFSR